MPGQTATGPVGVGLNRSLAGTRHELLCVTGVSSHTPQLSSITTTVATVSSLPVKAALRYQNLNDLEDDGDGGGCKQWLLALFQCSPAPSA